jgi:hypothetical protein
VTLRLGARSAVPVTATVAADDELAGTRVDGIVGQDVLSGLVYTIDYSRRQIFWDDTMPEADERRLELQFTNGRALVIIPPQAGMPHPLQLIPDTGADHVVLFTRRGRELPPFTPLDIGLLRTLAGQQLVRRVLIDALNVGGVDLLRQSAVILPSDAEALSLADGLLPLHLFSRVTVNGPERYLSVAR